MTAASYRRLIDGICTLSDLGNPEELYEKAALHVDGVEFVLEHGGAGNADGIVLWCSCGIPPLGLLPMIMARLLEANLKLFAPGGLRFGIHPINNEVVLAGVLPLADLDAAACIDLLHDLASQVRDWREHFFVLPPAELRPAEWTVDLPAEGMERRP